MSIEETALRIAALAAEEMTSQAGTAGSGLQGLIGEMESLNGQLDTDWEFVSSRVESLVSAADDAMGRIRTAGEAMAAKADAVAAGMVNAGEQDGGFQEAATTLVQSLEQGVQELVPDLDAMVASVEDTFSTMGSELQSQFGSLDDLRSTAENFLRGDFSSLVNQVGETILNRCGDLGTYIDADALVTVADEVSQLATHVDGIVSDASAKIEEVRSALESNGSAAMDDVMNIFNEKFGGLIQTAQTVADLIDRVGQAISGLADGVGAATKALSQGVNMTAIGAKSAMGIITDITEIFSSVT